MSLGTGRVEKIRGVTKIFSNRMCQSPKIIVEVGGASFFRAKSSAQTFWFCINSSFAFKLLEFCSEHLSSPRSYRAINTNSAET